jgi:hypothetical protein
MKNGIFMSKLPILFLALLSLQGCASFLVLGESGEDPSEYDRGYTRADSDGEGVDSEANTEAMIKKRQRGEDSDTSDDLGYEQRRIKQAIEMRDVVLGMTRHQVQASWGSPTQREVAGRGAGGHERWTFGSRYSLNGSRTVIFENGRVAGWSH